MKLTINLADDLVKRVDDFASKNYINRTSALCVLLTRSLQADDVSESVISMRDAWENLKDIPDVKKS